MKKSTWLFVLSWLVIFFLISYSVAWAENQPPTADAGIDQSVSEGSLVTLDGSNSSDTDDGIASFFWLQTQGPEVQLSNPSAAQPTFTPDVGIEGAALTFQLTVTDLGQLTSTDSVTINVSWVNAPPTADAGEDQTVTPGMLVTLYGDSSFDSDDGISDYFWNQISGPEVVLSNASAVNPTFTAPEVGSEGGLLKFRLSVTDNAGLQTSDNTIVQISFTATQPVADAGTDQNVTSGDFVTLDGTKSLDADLGIASYQWIQTKGPEVVLNDAQNVRANFTAPEVGQEGTSLSFELTVTDKSGLQSSDSVIVAVAWKNEAPAANAGQNQTVGEGVEVTLDASESLDPDDGIATYQWTQITGQQVALSDPNAVQPTFISPEVEPNGETLTFQLIVTDTGGLTSSAKVIVNVSWQNTGPVANAGQDQTISSGTIGNLDGSASSDPDDGIVRYVWTQTSGPKAELSDYNIPNPIFTAPRVSADGAAMTFRLTITDKGGLQSQDSVIVDVVWLNEPPYTDAGPDQKVVEGQKVILNGSNSQDLDTGIASYQWIQTAGPQVALSDSAIVQPEFTAPDAGPDGISLTFQLTITDNDGLKSSDSCIINVLWMNMPPVADAGTDQTVSEGTQVILDASASWDPDDVIESFFWKQTSGPLITLDNPASSFASFTAPDVNQNGASLTFQLTVKDTGGLKTSDTIIVNSTWVNAPPIAIINEGQEVKTGDMVNLKASESFDPDGEALTYIWKQTQGHPVTLSEPSSPAPNFVAGYISGKSETLGFQVIIKDESGLQASDETLVIVKDNGITGFPDGVTTFKSANNYNLGISAKGLTCLNSISSIDDTENKPEDLIYELIQTCIKTESGTNAEITFYFPEPALPEYIWYQYSNNWIKYDNVKFNEARDQITITVTDGGYGDEDGQINGLIINTSGLGIGKPEKEDDDTVCFIQTIDFQKNNFNMLSVRDILMHYLFPAAL